MVLEKTLESPLNSKEIKSVNPKGNQPWIFIGRTDAEVEAPILGPPDVKSQLTRKDLHAGKDGGQEEKEGWQRMRWLDGFTDSMDMSFSKLWEIVKDGEGQWRTVKDSEEQGSLVCCSPWGCCKESDMTEWLNNNSRHNNNNSRHISGISNC